MYKKNEILTQIFVESNDFIFEMLLVGATQV